MTNEEAINVLKSKMDGSVDTSYEWAETVRMAIKALEQPEIVRCKDCKYSDIDNTLGVMFCWRVSYHEASEDGFCSWAERRTDDLQ